MEDEQEHAAGQEEQAVEEGTCVKRHDASLDWDISQRMHPHRSRHASHFGVSSSNGAGGRRE